MPVAKPKFTSIDDYIASFPPDVQKVLEQVRIAIKRVQPKLEEKISYGIPAFWLNGKYVIYFAGWKNHVSLYPIPVGDDVFNEKISHYVSGRGTVKFPLDKPLPLPLIREMVKLRMADGVK